MNETIGCIPQPMDECVSMGHVRSNEMLRDHELSINFLHRGCIVKVGCKQIAFEDIDKAMQEIQRYVADPVNVGSEWRKILG